MPEKHHNSTRRLLSSRNTNRPERHQVEVSSGGFVFRRLRGRVEVVMLKDSYGRFTFPKGHVQAGESYVRGAQREIAEETGLKRVRYIRTLGHIDIWFRDRYVEKGKLIHKFIHYYLFEAPADAVVRLPTPIAGGERIGDVLWVPLEEVYERSGYKDLRPIIRRALETLEQKRRKPVK